MKFGFRIPSLKKRFAARTSPKRFIRHSLGLKAPRGFGWFTNPKKALYNRVYNRTTFSVDSLFKSGRRRSNVGQPGVSASGGGAGCLVVFAVLFIVGAFGALADAIGGVGAASVAIGLTVAASAVAHHRAKERASVAAAEEERQRALRAYEAQRWEAWRAERFAYLSSRFGPDAAGAIMRGEIWLGATREIVLEALGVPVAVEEKQLKTKRKTVLKYGQTGANRFALRVTLDDDVVVRWDGAVPSR